MVAFSVVIISGALVELLSVLDYASCKFLLRPLPENVIFVHHLFSEACLVALLIAGIGILYLKDIFRKIILFVSCFTLFTYLIEAPLIVRNIPEHINRQAANLAALPFNQLPLSTWLTCLWIATAVVCALDFGFALFGLYYFTRPKIKALFK